MSDEEIQTMADAIEHQINKLTGQPSNALSANEDALPKEVLSSVPLLAKDGKETR